MNTEILQRSYAHPDTQGKYGFPFPWTAQEKLDTNGYSKNYLIPGGSMYIGCGMIITGTATGQIEFTLSSPDEIANEIANWTIWASGAKSVTTYDTIIKATGIRLKKNSGAGSIKLEVVV